MNENRPAAWAAGSLAGLVCLATFAAAPAAAQDITFAGENIELIVPFGEGGGADTWTRVVAPFLAKHLAGAPNVVIRNVPGGGATVGANRFQQTAKPDGKTIMTASTSLNLAYVLNPEDERFQFDPKTWIPFFASPQGAIMYSTTSLGPTTVEELKDYSASNELRIPVQEVTSSDIRALLSLEMLEIASEPVYGMDGGDAQLAFERGEVHLGRDTTSAYLLLLQPMVDAGKAFPLFTFGYLDEAGQMGRDPTFPDLPSFVEVYEEMMGKPPSGPEFDAWMSFFNVGVMNSRQLLLPEGTPDEIVAVYDAAAAAMVADPEFQAAAKEQLGGYQPMIGEAARESRLEALSISPEAREWVAGWLKRRYDVTL